MLKDIFGSLGFVIVGSDILFWAYFFIMDKVSVFESSDFGELRIIVDPKGDVWFVASDVAKSLGYINAKDAVKRHVDDDDSMLLQVSDNQWGVKRSILKTRYIDSIFRKDRNKKKGSVFYSFKTLPINKLKKIYHILKIHF